ncbi:MAG: VOC family protein [Limnochordales bacterium]
MTGKGIGYPVAQLAHVELFTPKPEESLWFFRDFLGMEPVAQEGQSVYLRGYEDNYTYSLKLTERDKPGLGHVAWRTFSREALEECARRLKDTPYGLGWSDGDLGHGPSYRIRTPDGHPMELVWELEYYTAPDGQRSQLKSRPQKRPLRGIPVRRIDHVNLMCKDPVPNREFFMDQLGFLWRESKLGEGGVEVGAWLSVSAIVHEVAVMRDRLGLGNRLHHVAYWYGYPQHIFDVADTAPDYGITVETGPGKHGTTQAYFMYVFEPGGNRVELFGDTGYLIFDPDWKTIVWDVSNEVDLERSSIWFGGKLPESFYTYGTPHPEVPAWVQRRVS